MGDVLGEGYDNVHSVQTVSVRPWGKEMESAGGEVTWFYETLLTLWRQLHVIEKLEEAY